MSNSNSEGLTLRARIRHRDHDRHYFEIGFRCADASTKTVIVPCEDQAKPHLIVQAVLRRGGLLPPKHGAATRAVRQCLAQEPLKSLDITSVTGWHGNSFVLPDITIGPESESLRFAGALEAGIATTPTREGIEDWRLGMAPACAASSYLTFGVALGFAGPLLEPCGQEEGAFFCFVGEGSTGKSLCELAADSLTGPAHRRCLLTHDITPRALEEAASRANHLVLVIDELGRLTGGRTQRRKRISELGYIIAAGQGRLRSETVKDTLPHASFQLFGLTSSERSFETMFGYDERLDGELYRWIEIPVPNRGSGGIFDAVTTLDQAKALAAQVEQTTHASSGMPIRAFLQEFAADYEKNVAEAKRLVERFVHKVRANDQWRVRFAAKFGCVYAAAKLAAQFGIAPWKKDWPYKCIAKLYRATILEAITPEVAADDLTRLIASRARSSRFPKVDKGASFPEHLAGSAWGIRRRYGDTRIVALLRNQLESLVTPSRHARAVLPILAERGLLLPGKESGRYVRQLMVQGLGPTDRLDFICFDQSKLPFHGDISRESKGS